LLQYGRFHTGGKHCLWRMALKTFMTKVTVRLGGYLRAPFGIPFGPKTLPLLSPLMTSSTSEGLLNFSSFVGAYYMRARPH
jgi:hypothetical protein